MFLGTLLFPGRDSWLLPALGVFVVGLLLLVWSYRQGPSFLWVRITCAVLKTLGLVALLLCLLEPLWSGRRARPGANLFVVLADNSQGMKIQDRGEVRSRGKVLTQTLVGEGARWLEQMEKNFQVRRYLFDSRLQSTRDFAELNFEGRASAMATALRTIDERLKGQPLAGILLFTDGNATDVSGGLPDLEGLPPVYPVISGKNNPIKDVAIQRVMVTQTAFEDAPVSIQADVATTGYSGATLLAQLLEIEEPKTGATDSNAKPSEKVVEELSQKAGKEVDLLTFRFQIRPTKSGISFYQFRVSARNELDQFEDGAVSAEATLANNRRVLVVDRGRGPYRILYVAGRPNWEYKFLNRAVVEDDQIQLVGLIRVARREPKFQFKGRFGEASNPLYRGFDRTTEDTEHYDQPVLIRLNTRDELELIGGFPKTAEELYGYHAVIVDDLEAAFFTPEQKMLLQKFVSERGGGFLMLGGLESFHPGKYDRTPIGDMLPVYVDRDVQNRPLTNFRLSLTQEGWLEPWMRLRSTELEERARLRDLPFNEVINQARGIKPGATVMAQVTDAGGQSHPALVVQRFGFGRTGALLLGDLWRWGLQDESTQRDLAKAWRQIIRWLVADVPERTVLQAIENRGEPNQPVSLQLRIRDKDFKPMDNALVTLTVRPVARPEESLSSSPSSTRDRAELPDGAPGPDTGDAASGTVRLLAEPSVEEPGLYTATYIPRETGGYHAEAVVTNDIGAAVGSAETGWSTDLAAEEFRSLKPNPSLLEAIAKQTGGEIIEPNRLPEFVQSLPDKEVPITEEWTLPLWHQPIVFLFALACFIAEWGLRRWKGMA